MKVVGIGILVVVAIGIVLIHHVFFREWTSFEDTSVSPDGMYKCELKETQTPGQCNALIKVYQRKDLTALSGEDLWEPLEEAKVYNDSVSRSSYSIDWEYDDDHRTRKLIVFGDFGTPPFPGEIIFEMPLTPKTKRRNSRQGSPTGLQRP